MRKAGCQASLLLESAQEIGIRGELRQQDLDGNAAAKAEILGLVHTSHPALTEHADQAISSAKHNIIHGHKGSMRPCNSANTGGTSRRGIAGRTPAQQVKHPSRRGREQQSGAFPGARLLLITP